MDERASPLTDVVEWTLVFLVNLPIPGIVAYGFAGDSGWPGGLAALGLLWIAGGVACWRSPDVGGPLLQGSKATALLQVVPMLHLAAVFLVVRHWKWLSGLVFLGDPLLETGMSPTAGFFVTLGIVGPVFLAALAIGVWLESHYGRYSSPQLPRPRLFKRPAR